MNKIIKNYVRLRGINAAELCNRLGINMTAYRRYMNYDGSCNPRITGGLMRELGLGIGVEGMTAVSFEDSLGYMRRLLKERGIKQKDICSEIGISHSTISQQLNGKSKVSDMVYRYLMELLGLDVVHLKE